MLEQDRDIVFDTKVPCLAARQIPADEDDPDDTDEVAFSCYSGLDENCEYRIDNGIDDIGTPVEIPVGNRALIDIEKREVKEITSILYEEARLYYDTIIKLGGGSYQVECVGGYLDADGDNVPYPEDLCPYKPGLVDVSGCPDVDGDLLPDPEDLGDDVVSNFVDACPDDFGPVDNQGCQRFAFDIFSNDKQCFAHLRRFFKDRQKIFHG